MPAIAYEPLPDDCLVFRVLLSDDWMNKTVDPWVAAAVAFLRQDKDTKGISVRLEPKFCFKGVSHKNVYGIAELRVGDVRSVMNPINGQRLNVVQDKDDHASITNVPFNSQDPLTANDLGGDLADLASILVRKQIEWVLNEARSSGLIRASVFGWLTERLLHR